MGLPHASFFPTPSEKSCMKCCLVLENEAGLMEPGLEVSIVALGHEPSLVSRPPLAAFLQGEKSCEGIDAWIQG